MKRTYRKGAIGALQDELERAGVEFQHILETVSESEFVSIVDRTTSDEDCRSLQTIAHHVIRSGFGYADAIRDVVGIARTTPALNPPDRSSSIVCLRQMFMYMADTLSGRWELTSEEIATIFIRARWGTTYDLEQFLEHAIVHILRHRRQSERFLETLRISLP